MPHTAHAIATFDYAVRLKKDPKNPEKFYVVGYHNEMEVLPDGRRRSRVAELFHIGPLQDDNSVKLGKAFLKRYPNFEGAEVFYLKNRLFTKAQYQKAIQAQAALGVEHDETVALPPSDDALPDLECASSLVFDAFAKKNDLLPILRNVFNERASSLYSLLLYLASDLGSLTAYNDVRNTHYLACGQSLTVERIRDLLNSLTPTQIQAFWKAYQATHLSGDEAFCSFTLDAPKSCDRQLMDYALWSPETAAECFKAPRVMVVMEEGSGRVLYAEEPLGAQSVLKGFESITQAKNTAQLFPNDHRVLFEKENLSDAHTVTQSGATVIMPADVSLYPALRTQLVEKATQLQRSSNRLSFSDEPIYGMAGDALTVSTTVDGKVTTLTLIPHLYVNTLQKTHLIAALDWRILRALGDLNAKGATSSPLDPLLSPFIKKENGVWVEDDDAIARHRALLGTFVLWTTNQNDSPEVTLMKWNAFNEADAFVRGFFETKGLSQLITTQNAYHGTLLLLTLAMSLREQLRLAILSSMDCQMAGIKTVEAYLSKVAGIRAKFAKDWRVLKPTAQRRHLLDALSIPASLSGSN